MKNILARLKCMLYFCLSITFLALGSCGDDETEYTGIKISDYSYVFPAEGGQFTVKVTAPSGWETEYDEAGWISETGRTANSLTFEAAPNASAAMNELHVRFTSGEDSAELTLYQDIKNTKFTITGHIYAISKNGEYIVCTENTAQDKVRIFSINTKTDEQTTLFETAENIRDINAISNDGTVLLVDLDSDGYNDGVYIKNGQITRPSMPAGHNEMSLNDLNSDGSVIVGNVTRQDSGMQSAIKVVGTTTTILNGPTETRIDEEGYLNRVTAEAISADGNIIIGIASSGWTNEGIFWKDDQWQWMGPLAEEEVDDLDMDGNPVVVTKYFSSMVNPRDNNIISPDGKFAGINFYTWGQNRFGLKSMVTVPALFNTETEEVTAFYDIKDKSEFGGESFTATDSGILSYYVTIDFMGGGRETYVLRDGVATPSNQYLKNLLGINVGETVQIRRMVESDPVIVVGSFINRATLSEIPFYLRQE